MTLSNEDLRLLKKIEEKARESPPRLNEGERIVLRSSRALQEDIAFQKRKWKAAERAAEGPDPLRAAQDQAERIVEALGGSRPTGRSFRRVPAVEARPPRERPRTGTGLRLMFVVEKDQRGTPGYAPEAFEARFVTDLGHYGVSKKPRVLQLVAGPPESHCRAFRDYPGRKQIQELFETAWTHYDTPAFDEIPGDVTCENRTHARHSATATFSGLKMEDLGIEGWGVRPEPEKPRPTPGVEPEPTAEEVLAEAVRRAKAAGES